MRSGPAARQSIIALQLLTSWVLLSWHSEQAGADPRLVAVGNYGADATRGRIEPGAELGGQVGAGLAISGTGRDLGSEVLSAQIRCLIRGEVGT